MELVYADICGSIKPKFNSGKRCFITFVDDTTRRTWVYFLSEKSSALESFKKFKLVVEKDSGEFIFCFRTDRGWKFTSTEFEKFCSNNGVKIYLTPFYTPQQNGVAERKNKTITDMVS